jgi:hypothetical protein
MTTLLKTLAAATLLSGISIAPAHAANTLTINGTLLKNASGTTFDTWKFKILGTGNFNVDVAAYEASQNNVATAGYYTHDINADGELTWLDSDTYFYHDSGSISATDAIFRCDDVENNCGGATGASNYFNSYTPATSPLTRTTRLLTETSVDGSVHFRRDAWYDVTVNTPGDYLFLMADFRLDPAEAAGGINANDSFSPPGGGFVNPILDHADYKVTFSSANMLFSINGNTITVSQVPVPGAVWLFGSVIAGMAGFVRRKSTLNI